MDDLAYFNGQTYPLDARVIPIEERGHQFGDGVYEGIRVYAGKPFLLESHVERLMRSLQALAIHHPHTHADWCQDITAFIAQSNVREAFLYLQVTRGIAPRTHVFPSAPAAVSMTIRSAAAKPVGQVKALCVPDDRWPNAYIKSLNLLPNTLAKEAAKRHLAFEAIMVREGKLLEGSSSNLWFVVGNTLRTAPANRWILAGITRAYVMDVARVMGFTVEERAVSLADLQDVDDMFLTGTSTEIQPIDLVQTQTAAIPQLTTLSDVPFSPLQDEGRLQTLWTTRSRTLTKSLADAFERCILDFRAQA